MTGYGSRCAAKTLQVKNFLISASLVAVGVWYFHRVSVDRANLSNLDEQKGGEIVVANAPDGTLRGRWGNAAPTLTASR